MPNPSWLSFDRSLDEDRPLLGLQSAARNHALPPDRGGCPFRRDRLMEGQNCEDGEFIPLGIQEISIWLFLSE